MKKVKNYTSEVAGKAMEVVYCYCERRGLSSIYTHSEINCICSSNLFLTNEWVSERLKLTSTLKSVRREKEKEKGRRKKRNKRREKGIKEHVIILDSRSFIQLSTVWPILPELPVEFSEEHNQDYEHCRHRHDAICSYSLYFWHLWLLPIVNGFLVLCFLLVNNKRYELKITSKPQFQTTSVSSPTFEEIFYKTYKFLWDFQNYCSLHRRLPCILEFKVSL